MEVEMTVVVVTVEDVTSWDGKSIDNDESSLTGVFTPPITTLLLPPPPLCRILLLLAAKLLLKPAISSGMLAESGKTDSRSPPEHSLPGDCDGITNVTSNWNTQHKSTILATEYRRKMTHIHQLY
jgi:hypothetical protein